MFVVSPEAKKRQAISRRRCIRRLAKRWLIAGERSGAGRPRQSPPPAVKLVLSAQPKPT